MILLDKTERRSARISKGKLIAEIEEPNKKTNKLLR